MTSTDLQATAALLDRTNSLNIKDILFTNDLKQEKAANPHNGNTGTRKCLTFLLENEFK